MLLRPLPFPRPDRLFLVTYHPQHGPFFCGRRLFDTQYLEFEHRNQSFEQVATLAAESPALTGVGQAVRLSAAAVTSGSSAVLGVHPEMGRIFPPEEQQAQGAVAVLSDHPWRSRFRGDPGSACTAFLPTRSRSARERSAFA